VSVSVRTQNTKPLTVDFALAAVVVMWASTFTLFKVAWRDIDPVAFTAVRFALMVLFSFAVLRLSRSRVRLERRDIPLVVGSGLAGFFAYQMSFVLGLDRTSAVASAILVSTHPIFSLLFMWLFGREQARPVEIAGVVVGFAGVAVFLRAWDAFGAATLGDLLSLVAAASFGAYGAINIRLVHRLPSRELMAYGLLAGGSLVALVGIPAIASQDWSSVSAKSWLILVYAIVGPVYLAYALWNWAIARQGVPRTVIYGFLVPVVAGAIAVWILDESVRWEQGVGALMVVSGLVVARRGKARSAARGPLLEEPA
jgi:drug/metabolite transporter (DMT)-like permease